MILHGRLHESSAQCRPCLGPGYRAGRARGRRAFGCSFAVACLRRARYLARRQRDRVRRPAATSGPCRRPAATRACSSRTPRNESRPLFSPDGTQLAFVSTRTGGGDIYVLTLATGDVRRLTFDDGLEQLDGWSRDGKWLYFFSTSRDISGGMNDVYRVRADGGTPMPVSAERYANEFFAAPSPDGQVARDHARAAARPASGGGKATATSTRPRSGCAI